MSYTIPIAALSINASGQIVSTGPYTSISLTTFEDFAGSSAPALSAAGHGRIYFDSTSNSFLMSQNGAAYTTLGGGGGGSGTVNSGTAGNLAYYATTGAAVSDAGVQAGNLVQLSGSQSITGVKTFSKIPILPIVSYNASGGAITPDATVTSVVFIDVDTSCTINGPTGGFDGQKILFRIWQGTGSSFPVTFTTGSGNFRFSTDIPGYSAAALQITDYVGAAWNPLYGVWDIIGVTKGF